MSGLLGSPLIRLAASRVRLPGRTLRLRLTLLYGGLFLLSGAVLLAITYLLVVGATSGFIFSTQTDHGRGHATIATGVHHGHPLVVVGAFAGRRRGPTNGAKGRASSRAQSVSRLQAQAERQHSDELHELLVQSGIALAGMAVVSIVLGWIVAGRALRPLRTITRTAREISASNLHRRLELDGPDDELKDLGDTIDGLLARLEASFRAQRAFVANASHELRTPLALTRAMLQFALADPELTLDSLKATCAEVLSAGVDHEQLLEALLTLARGQQGIERPTAFDLAPIAEAVVEAHRGQAADHQLTLDCDFEPAAVAGDPRLAERLIDNLIDNAVRHNIPGGTVRATLTASSAGSILAVTNTGLRVAPDQIARLLQPFRRLAPDRATDAPGHGLGLSIVAAIAGAHGAALDIQGNPDGGMAVAVVFGRQAPGGVADRPRGEPLSGCLARRA